MAPAQNSDLSRTSNEAINCDIPTTTHYSDSEDGTISKCFRVHEMIPCTKLSSRILNVYGKHGKMLGKLEFRIRASAQTICVALKLQYIGDNNSIFTCNVSRSFFTGINCSHPFYYSKMLTHPPLLQFHADERTEVQIKEGISACDGKRKVEEVTEDVDCIHGLVKREIKNHVRPQKELEAEIGSLKEKLLKQTRELKACHEQIQELKGNIRVFCRCRPLTLNEQQTGDQSVVGFSPLQKHELHVQTNCGLKKTFKFDRVFTPSHSQEEVFFETAPLVVSVLDGCNVCIFAYGQTGTGKTFTMEGSENDRGINYRTLEKLFQLINQRKGQCRYELSVSVLEVYNEEIRDLLIPTQYCKKLEIKQGAEGMHHVLGAVEAPVHSIDEVWNILQTGCRARVVGSTNANSYSSRSHCLVCVMVKCENLMTREVTRSKLWLIDLAGSERIKRTDVCGERLKEAQNINKSLSALGDVIQALTVKNSYIPYRNSKITHLLQDSLGGCSKTLMFVQISPNEHDVGETLCSLTFATRVRGVELGAARKQLDPAELLKFKKMVEKTQEDGLKKDVVVVELQAAIKVKEQFCKTLSGKVKEHESLLANERKARITAEQKLKEQQMLLEKQRILIEKLSADLKAKQPGPAEAPSTLTKFRRPPLQERQPDNREPADTHQSKKRAPEGGCPQKENIADKQDGVQSDIIQHKGLLTPSGILPLGKRRAAHKEEEGEELRNDARVRGRARASLCVLPPSSPHSNWGAKRVKPAERRTRRSMACPVDLQGMASFSSSYMRGTPTAIRLQSPFSVPQGCREGEFVAKRVMMNNAARGGKPPQHPQQPIATAITEALQYKPKRLLVGGESADVPNKMRRFSAACASPHSGIMPYWAALPSSPAALPVRDRRAFPSLWEMQAGAPPFLPASTPASACLPPPTLSGPRRVPCAVQRGRLR